MTNSLATVENPFHEFDETIQGMSEKLITLGDQTEDESAKERLYELAAQVSPAIEGMDEDEETRAKMPFVKIRQGTSKDAPDGVKLGQIYTNTGEVIGDKFTFIPLYQHKARVLFREGDKPECMSFDTVTGTRHGDCATCPFAQYEKDGPPSECRRGRTFYAMSTDGTRLYQMGFFKTNAKAGDTISDKFIRSVYGYQFELSVVQDQQKTGSKAKFFRYEAARGEKTPPAMEELAKLLNVYFSATHKKNKLRTKLYNDKRLLNTGVPETNGASLNALDAHGEAAPNTDAIDFSQDT